MWLGKVGEFGKRNEQAEIIFETYDSVKLSAMCYDTVGDVGRSIILDIFFRRNNKIVM